MNTPRTTPRHSCLRLAALAALLLLPLTPKAQAPLGNPPQPPQNPTTPAKANLGKALFFEEQMSSPRTVACATCHQRSAGGSDPRSIIGSLASTNPGIDGIYGNPDDITGSPGVPPTNADASYRWVIPSGSVPQVTGRKSPSTINAAFSPNLFWDGRATGEFRDPITSTVIIPVGGALESQVLAPPVSPVEMGHPGRNWNDVAARIASVQPLALATFIPPALETWIGGRSYPELFEEAFGTPAVTPVRIAMAIAAYERTLVANQTPLDDYLAGNVDALTPQEEFGLDLFAIHECNACHSGNRFTNEEFHYIGVRPALEDVGRFSVTGVTSETGAFRTPALRNVELRAPFMHDGSLPTLEEVVEFYNRGGDFNAPNKDPRILPMNLLTPEKQALVAFMKRPLTDPRVVAGLPPFDPVGLYAGSPRQPQLLDAPSTGSGGIPPRMIAVEPPLFGNPSFTVAVDRALGNTTAVLVISTILPPAVPEPPGATDYVRLQVKLAGTGPGQGYGSATMSLPTRSVFPNDILFGRWYISDPQAAGGFAYSAAFQMKMFGTAWQPAAADRAWMLVE